MGLTTCPDCGTEVSDRAVACPKCGAPIAAPPHAKRRQSFKLDTGGGAICPNCRSNDTYRKTDGLGCMFAIIVLVSFGLGLLAIPFLPKTWHCRACGNQWRG